MKIKVSRGERIFQVFNYCFLTLVAFICIYPMWHVFMGSFSSGSKLATVTGAILWPMDFTVEAYKKVFQNPLIFSGYRNTIFIIVVSLFTDMILTTIAAYFFSRKKVMLKKPLMLMILFTMYVDGGTIPFYLTLKEFHLTNSLWGLIIPFMISTYNMIILRTAFEAIPDSLTEAARIDGAGHITILAKIILPLSKASLAVIALYYGVAKWNSWFWGSTILRDKAKYPLQSVLREILISGDTSGMEATGVDAIGIEISIKYATIMVATIPILLIYPFIQKYFTKGVMIGAVKE